MILDALKSNNMDIHESNVFCPIMWCDADVKTINS